MRAGAAIAAADADRRRPQRRAGRRSRPASAGSSALGKATTGEKTMLDALVPAHAAGRGRRSTAGGDHRRPSPAPWPTPPRPAPSPPIPMLATKGRASYLGERSIGHQDPGATSSALLLRALADAVAAG